jgi:SAM-dependent methyltransferase
MLTNIIAKAVNQEENMAFEEVYRYPADYDLEVEACTVNDVPFWVDLLRCEQPARMLEIGCGTGRLTVPLAREGTASGFSVTGLDIEAAMLSRESADVRKVVQFVQGDVRFLQLDEHFDVILMPYGVAHHLTDLDEQIAAWESVHKHLMPGGLFAVDLVAPDLPLMAQALHGVPRSIDLDVHRDDGRHIRRSVAVNYEPTLQQATFAFVYDVVDADGTHRHYQSPFAMHVYYPYELELLFRLTGFYLERFVGSYAGEPFTASSSLMIALARSRK